MTASLLDPGDAELLHRQFHARRLSAEVSCSVTASPLDPRPAGWSVRGLATAISLHARSVAGDGGILRGVRCRTLPLIDSTARIANGLAHVTGRPVVRARIDPAGLPAELRESLARWLAQRFAGAEVQLLALYPEVPPECSGSLSVAPDYANVQFTPASATAQARTGFFLAIVAAPDGRTKKLLIRL